MSDFGLLKRQGVLRGLCGYGAVGLSASRQRSARCHENESNTEFLSIAASCTLSENVGGTEKVSRRQNLKCYCGR